MNKSSFDALKILDDDSDDWDKESLNGLSSHIMDFRRYDIQELIAKGGMKEIYKAYDRQNARFIAMAKLRTDVKDEQSEDFLKEAFLTAALEHPNIISLYDTGVDKDGYPIFTMELKVGDTLTDILKERHKENPAYLQKFPLSKRLDIFMKICDAIAYAHSQGILHLDIKPDNIQVGTFGEVQVCDWGLGTKVENANKARVKGLVKGTPGYMAPEQIDNEKLIGFHSDIYSLGALLYSILTDKEPMNGGMLTLIKKTVSGDLPEPKDQCPEMKISESLNAVVTKAMAVNPDERYKSVEELKAEVESFLSGRSTSAENAGFLKEAQLFYKRNSLICLIILLSLVILISLSSLFLYKQKLSNSKVQRALDESEKNYRLYKEKMESEKALTNTLLVNNYTKEYQEFEGQEFFGKKTNKLGISIKNMLELHSALPKNNIISNRTAEVLFIAQRFDELLNLEDKGNPSLVEIAKKFATVSQRKKGLLINSDFEKLLKELNSLEQSLRQSLMERMVYFHYRRKEDSYAGETVVKELIKCWNKDWNENNFSYDINNYTLKIRGENLKTLKGKGKYTSELSFLRFLKIDSLILSESGIENLDEIRLLDIENLDISKTGILDVKHLKMLPKLKRLIIDKDQISKKALNKTYSWITIEEK